MIGKSARAYFGSTMRIRGVSSDGRAPALQAGGHRFDPGTLHFFTIGVVVRVCADSARRSCAVAVAH